MNADDLRNLLTQREGLKLDFKREYQLSKIPPSGINQQDWKNLTAGQWDELIKDILALTNGNFGTSEDPGLLVIGAGDDKDLQPDGTRPLFDMRHLLLNSQQIIETVNKACYPPIADIVCEEIDLDGKFIVLITIPPSSVVHETTRKLRTVRGVIDASGQLRTTGQKEYTERTAFIRRGEGIYSATEAERRALATDKSPETFILSSPLLDLEEFIISEAEREKVRSVLVLPHGIEKARGILNRRKRLWLIGPPGLWKRYLAVSMAMEHPGREIYRVPRFVDWSQLAETNVRDSILIFPDALGLIQSESEKVGGEFRPWEKLLANGNIIIASSPEDVFYEAAREARGLEVLSREGTFPLNTESFSYKSKCAIYERLVIYSGRSGVITEAQKEWALDLVELKSRHDSARTAPGKAVSQAQLQHLLQEVWLPVDIERFVIDSLPDARSAEEISDLLRRDADIETRVHSWFGQLDDSTRCFVLSLTLFSGFPNKEIWARHQDIVERLRRLDPGLSISPLGILRQHSHPYVTTDGPVEFVNPRLSKVIVKEVAKTYREYFTEILDLLKKWSIPDLPQSLTDEDRDQLISGTEDTRNAIARMAGEVGKFGLDDISDLLEAWATHRIGRISKTLGIALREVAMDPPSVNQVLALLSEWSSDTTSEDAEYRRWASASALGKIAAIGSRFGTSEQALMILQRLTDDHSDYVVSAVAHGFRMVGAALPVEALSGTLTRLAKAKQSVYETASRASHGRSGRARCGKRAQVVRRLGLFC